MAALLRAPLLMPDGIQGRGRPLVPRTRSPDAVLRRGPDDPAALDWLWAHWGTTQTLRHVTDDPSVAAAMQTRVPAGQGVWAVSFWSADWTPWRALAQIVVHWPALRSDTSPTYDTA